MHRSRARPRTEIEHDIDVDGAIVLRLHPECFNALLEC